MTYSGEGAGDFGPDFEPDEKLAEALKKSVEEHYKAVSSYYVIPSDVLVPVLLSIIDCEYSDVVGYVVSVNVTHEKATDT